MIKIALVDDHEIFLKGLQNLLQSQANIECNKVFLSADVLLTELPLQNTDILLLDLQLPDYEAHTLLKSIRKADDKVKIIYLTLMRGNRYFNKLDQSLFDGYLLKDSPLELLLEVIGKVYKGEKYFGDRYFENHQNTVTHSADKVKQLLSKRECEVLQLIALEYSNAQIAERLFLSVSTIDSHRKNLMIKLGVENTVGLMKVAINNGLI